MLHHQHAVPIPPNQLRDANRIAAQLPLRLGQPGSIAGPHRSRPPHATPILMGMFPSPPLTQPNGGPGVGSLPAPVMATGPGAVVPPPSHATGPPDVHHPVDPVAQHHRRHHRQRQFLHHLAHHPIPPSVTSSAPVVIQRPPLPPPNSNNHQMLLGPVSRQRREGGVGRSSTRIMRSVVENGVDGAVERRVGEAVTSTPASPLESRGVVTMATANPSATTNGVTSSENSGHCTPPTSCPPPPSNGKGGGGVGLVEVGSNDSSAVSMSQQQRRNVANTKEKTPMCLINELARLNKIQHQYRLINETGPAHKKKFTVMLQLGGEEYEAEGHSIKKAQHAAAALALSSTTHRHPPPRSKQTQRTGAPRLGKSNITPTVELNALAMKRGEPAVYTFLEPPPLPPHYPIQHHPPPHHPHPPHPPHPPPPPHPPHPPIHHPHSASIPPPHGLGLSQYLSPHGFSCRGIYNQRYHNHYGGGMNGGKPGAMNAPIYTPMYVVSLRVGDREFLGEGHNAQLARHDAASKALDILKNLPAQKTADCNGGVNDDGLTPAIETNGTQEEAGRNGANGNADLKSPISLVHELALKRGLEVAFEVTGERGPPHMRTFTTRCIVGDLITEGEGNGKKVSKKHAAEKMLTELRKLPPVSPPPVISNNRQRRKPNAKKKTRNLIKVQQEQKAKVDYGEDINPISRLIQIQQAKKGHEPTYALIEERGVPRHRREFVMEVSVEGICCIGMGPNKKLAKRAAAEELLRVLGYVRPNLQNNSSSPSKSAASSAISSSTSTLTGGMRNSSSSASSTSHTASVSSAMLPSEVKTKDKISEGNRKVTFLEDNTEEQAAGGSGSGSVLALGGSGGRQLVPGLLLIGDNNAKQNFNQSSSKVGQGNVGVRNVQSSTGNRIANLQTTATIAKELLRGGTSPTAEALMKSGAYHHQPSPTQSPPVHSDSKSGHEHRTKTRQQENNSSPVVRPKDQLMYLAQLLNFQVQFSDFPKGHSEFLSLVSLSTEPPQVCHGAGKTTDASHDQAALTALRALSELGLDSVTSSGSSLKKDVGGSAKSSINNSIGNSGEGVHVQPQSSGRQSQAPVIVASDGVAMGK